MKIVIAVAMEKEAHFLINELNLQPAPAQMQLPASLQTKIYHKFYNDNELILFTSGKDPIHKVDSIGCAIIPVATLVLHQFKPDLMINAGSAGGVGRLNAKPGDVYVCVEEITHHDRLFGPDKFHEPYGIGSYPTFDASGLSARLDIKLGRVSTGGSMIASQEENVQFQTNKAILKEMEAAHLAALCLRMETDFFALKVVTDLIDNDICPQEQFSSQLSEVMPKLAMHIKTVIHIIFNEGLKTIQGKSRNILVQPSCACL